MKTIVGKSVGFVAGFSGFLYLFKLLILDHTPPSDELAPGIVLFIATVSGLCFAFAGHRLQNYWTTKKV